MAGIKRIEVKCECRECENNDDGHCGTDYGITINAEGICDDFWEDE